MQLGPYRLLAQLGAGADAASYRAAADAGEAVEVRVLTAAFADPDRRKDATRRLRLAALLHHPAAIRVRELGLDHTPPFVALEAVEPKTLAEWFADSAPPPADALRIACDLCAVLAEAHHFGLAHGRLRPSAIRRDAAGHLKLDFTGLDAGVDATPPAALAEFEAVCRAPEVVAGGTPDAAADLYALGAILYWLVRVRARLPGQTPQEVVHNIEFETRAFQVSWQHFIPLLLAADPAHRPPAAFLTPHLEGRADNPADPLGAETVAGEPPSVAARRNAPPAQVGRFRILDKLGEGGMGSVYRAQDVSDGTVVAVKLLQGRWDNQEAAWRRLRKEARLLAEVNNPHVANFIEANEHDGAPYLVMEFVDGESLNKVLARRRQLTEAEAAAVMADVARALADAHRRGIIHRDVKPENILLSGEGRGARGEKGPEQGERARKAGPLSPLALRPSPLAPHVKLCDFGLARHVEQSASLNVTRDGAVVGTPFYASPEQCTGRPIDAHTDVYAMGATLFHLLAGRPPFLADTVLGMTHLHVNQAPPLRQFNPDVSDGMSRLVEKALSKDPDGRHADAEASLLDLERLRRGEAVRAVVHPRLPPADPREVLQYDRTWQLEAPPERLWPHVANTDRLNRAAGLPVPDFTSESDPAGGARRFGAFKKAGVVNAWREHPFEWVEGRRLGVLREYSRGVLKWLASTVEFETARRELFPGEALSPGQLVSLAALALLVTDLDPAGRLYEQLGDARAFGVLHGYLQAAGDAVKRAGGAVVKTVGEGLLASFLDPAAAVRVAVELAGRPASGPDAGIRPRVAVHRGPVLVATLNDHLDYFGATVSQATRLPQRVRGGDVALTHPVASDPQVAALLHARGLRIEVMPDESSEAPGGFLHRVVVPPAASL